MLTADQAHVARQAFEAWRRTRIADINKRLAHPRCAHIRERLGTFPDRLDRDAQGNYADGTVRIEWAHWCEAWHAALASVGLTS
jgi:hypothetical protein